MLKLNSSHKRIIEFLKNKEFVYSQDIAEEIDMNKPNCSRFMNQLEKESILFKKKEGKTSFFMFNSEIDLTQYYEVNSINSKDEKPITIPRKRTVTQLRSKIPTYNEFFKVIEENIGETPDTTYMWERIATNKKDSPIVRRVFDLLQYYSNKGKF